MAEDRTLLRQVRSCALSARAGASLALPLGVLPRVLKAEDLRLQRADRKRRPRLAATSEIDRTLHAERRLGLGMRRRQQNGKAQPRLVAPLPQRLDPEATRT